MARSNEPGSREPSPTVSALTGFDPSRVTTKQFGRSWFHTYYGDKYVALGKTKREAVELAVQKLSPLHVSRQPAQCAVPLPALQPRDAVAPAIATEARRAAAAKQGAVHEGAGPQDIAQGGAA